MRFRVVLIFLLVVFSFFEVIHAERVELDGIFYDLSEEAKTASVVAGYESYVDTIVIPEKVTYNEQEYVVTAIGDNAFYLCNDLKHVTIPNTVTSIGEGAFYQCWWLKEIQIPNSVVTIGANAFNYCSGLTFLTLPSSVVSIGDDAFKDCYKLREIYNQSDLNIVAGSKAYGNIAYYATNVYNEEGANKIKLIDNFVFYEDADNVVLLGQLTNDSVAFFPDTYYGKNYSIGESAFEGHIFTNITLPKSVTCIEKNAFTHSDFYGVECAVNYKGTMADWCNIDFNYGEDSYYSEFLDFFASTSLYIDGECITKNTELIIPEGVTEIKPYSFYGFGNLVKLTLPNSVIKIGRETFKNCNNLSEIVFSDNIADIGLDAFKGTKWDEMTQEGIIYIGKVLYAYRGAMLPNTSIEIKAGTMTIKDNAFQWCSNLASITIPNSVTQIGNNVFEGCRSLKSIGLPNGIVTIGNRAFALCDSVAKVEIPSSVTSIGSAVFDDCYNLVEIAVANDNQYYTSDDGILFNKEKTRLIKYPAKKVSTTYVLPNTVRIIEYGAFGSCSNLNSIELPNSVTSIEDYAFSYCYNLTKIVIPADMMFIGDNAFIQCVKLREVYNMSSLDIKLGEFTNGMVAHYAKNVYTEEGGSKIDQIGDYQFYVEEDNVELISYIGDATDLILPDDYRGACYTIGHNAFYFHDNITSLTIPYCVTSIGDYAFSNCSSLTSITLPDGLTSIGNNAFWGCSSLTSITLPDGLTSIGNSAFRLCTSLNSVVVPNSVTHIGNDAFSHCMNLKHITLSNSMERINYGLFYDCGSLISIVIPSSVVNIDGMSFYGCVSLKDVRVEDAFSKLEIGYNDMFGEKQWLFADCPLESVYIGRDLSFDTSKNAGYSPFYNQTGLKTVIIGENVTKLENYLLYNCSGIEKIISFSTTPPKASRLTFRGVNTDICSVTVPIGSLADYTSAAYWKSFFNVVEADLSGVGSIQTDNLNPVYYNLNGQRVLNPSKGIYIQNGKKVYIR